MSRPTPRCWMASVDLPKEIAKSFFVSNYEKDTLSTQRHRPIGSMGKWPRWMRYLAGL